MFALLGAARTARRQVESAQRPGGVYHLDDWPSPGTRRSGRGARRAVVRLRIAQRLTVGFLNPVDDAIYLTAGLRRLGYPATFHLGREACPATAPAGVFPWVRSGADVVSTSLPVDEEYVEVMAA